MRGGSAVVVGSMVVVDDADTDTAAGVVDTGPLVVVAPEVDEEARWARVVADAVEALDAATVTGMVLKAAPELVVTPAAAGLGPAPGEVEQPAARAAIAAVRTSATPATRRRGGAPGERIVGWQTRPIMVPRIAPSWRHHGVDWVTPWFGGAGRRGPGATARSRPRGSS